MIFSPQRLRRAVVAGLLLPFQPFVRNDKSLIAAMAMLF